LIIQIPDSGVNAGTLRSGTTTAITPAISSSLLYETNPFRTTEGHIRLFCTLSGTGYVHNYNADTGTWSALGSGLGIVGGDRVAFAHDDSTGISYFANNRAGGLTVYSRTLAGASTTEYPANEPNYYGNHSIISYACICATGSINRGNA